MAAAIATSDVHYSIIFTWSVDPIRNIATYLTISTCAYMHGYIVLRIAIYSYSYMHAHAKFNLYSGTKPLHGLGRHTAIHKFIKIYRYS